MCVCVGGGGGGVHVRGGEGGGGSGKQVNIIRVITETLAKGWSPKGRKSKGNPSPMK